MELKLAYLRDQQWEYEGEALGSEEGMVLGTGVLLGSTLGDAENVKFGLDDGNELGYLSGSL